MSISKDPKFDHVKDKWPKEQEHRTPLEGIDLASLKHFNMLYLHRNMLVHELRQPGYGIEFGKKDAEPFYHMASTSVDNGDFVDSVELVYPKMFLHRLCDTGLDQLKQYFLENQLDPFDSFTFGTYWIKELNR